MIKILNLYALHYKDNKIYVDWIDVGGLQSIYASIGNKQRLCA